MTDFSGSNRFLSEHPVVVQYTRRVPGSQSVFTTKESNEQPAICGPYQHTEKYTHTKQCGSLWRNKSEGTGHRTEPPPLSVASLEAMECTTLPIFGISGLALFLSLLSLSLAEDSGNKSDVNVLV